MNDPALVTIIIAGVVTIIGAIAAGIVTVIKAIHDTKAKLQQGAEEQNKELSTIKILVDGRYGEVLDELATLRETLANRTGLSEDERRATKARLEATAQDDRVKRAEEKD